MVLKIVVTYIALEFMESMVGIKTNSEATLHGGELEWTDFYITKNYEIHVVIT